MEVQSTTNSSVFEIYSKAIKEDIALQQKITKVAIEQKMEQEKFEIAEEALRQFYA